MISYVFLEKNETKGDGTEKKKGGGGGEGEDVDGDEKRDFPDGSARRKKISVTEPKETQSQACKNSAKSRKK